MWSDTQITSIGFRATLDCASTFTTKLWADDAAVQWADMSDGTKNLVIDADATNNVARFELRGTNAGTFEGIEDQNGTIVSYDVTKTTSSVTGKFRIDKTQTYTAVWAAASITCRETNKNQAYMYNQNQVTISGITRDVTIEVKYDERDYMNIPTYAGDPLLNGGYLTLSFPLYARNGASQVFNINYLPRRSGAVSYLISVKNTAGIVTTSKTISATIAMTTVKLDITLQYANQKQIGPVASYYTECQAVIKTIPEIFTGATEIAQITFVPTGYDVLGAKMANEDRYCRFWSLTPLSPYTNYISVNPPTRTITARPGTTYILWDEHDIKPKDYSAYEATGFNPTLNNLDGTVSVYDYDVLRRAFVKVQFPPIAPAGNAVKITYNTFPGLKFDATYFYTNNL